MRYYTYISDAKLELLHAQIPRRLLSRLAGELQLDLKVASVSLKGAPHEITRVDRLRLVERYIDENCDVGWLSEPRSWFRGELGLRMGVVTGAALYTGLDAGTLVALIGSAGHLVDRQPSGSGGELHHRTSDLPALITLMESRSEESVNDEFGFYRDREHADEQAALRQVVYFAQEMRAPRQPVEFLARRLFEGTTRGPDGKAVHVVVGTPLYVALSDE
ncbi:DUF7019 family protein [Amycolatopsis sp. NPDC058340]|uniref:DUF7019 family protein n=1 Tax=Amycolatopsis sp. NPDC058340 TaxID=3346453 RepID=UPI00364C0269